MIWNGFRLKLSITALCGGALLFFAVQNALSGGTGVVEGIAFAVALSVCLSHCFQSFSGLTVGQGWRGTEAHYHCGIG